MLSLSNSTALLGRYHHSQFGLSLAFNSQKTVLQGFPVDFNFRKASCSYLRQQSAPTFFCQAQPELPDALPGRADDLPLHGLSETVVGVLGGGQLGGIICQAASKMAIKVAVLDPMENCPASALAHHHMVRSYDDSTTTEEFAKRCGVLTVEIEHVDADMLEKLEQKGVDCQPKASTIRIIQGKYLQKGSFFSPWNSAFRVYADR